MNATAPFESGGRLGNNHFKGKMTEKVMANPESLELPAYGLGEPLFMKRFQQSITTVLQLCCIETSSHHCPC